MKGRKYEQIKCVPQEKTIKEILDEIGDTPCRCSKFIEINKIGMVEIGTMDDFDYEIFWECMKIYESCGINYFSNYVDLHKGYYGDFTQGIEAWFNSRSIMGYRPAVDKFIELVDTLRFFEITSYCGIVFSEYEEACQKANGLYQMATDNEMQHRQEKSEENIRKRIENYFNFDNYSVSKFEALSQGLIERQKKSISINEALMLARFAPQNTYIVILKKIVEFAMWERLSDHCLISERIKRNLMQILRILKSLIQIM